MNFFFSVADLPEPSACSEYYCRFAGFKLFTCVIFVWLAHGFKLFTEFAIFHLFDKKLQMTKNIELDLLTACFFVTNQ